MCASLWFRVSIVSVPDRTLWLPELEEHGYNGSTSSTGLQNPKCSKIDMSDHNSFWYNVVLDLLVISLCILSSNSNLNKKKKTSQTLW